MPGEDGVSRNRVAVDRAAQRAGRYPSNSTEASGRLAGPPQAELGRGTLVSSNGQPPCRPGESFWADTLQFCSMERPPYRTRLRKRTWRETRASVRGRIVPFVIGALGLVFGYLINLFWLHRGTAKELVIVGAVSFGGSYAVWFLGALIANTIRAPWLLDAESGEQINALERRAIEAENKADLFVKEKQESKRFHDLFGSLINAGMAFSSDLASCTTTGQFMSWDRHFNDWVKKVKDTIAGMGYMTDALEFVRAAEAAEPVKGVMDYRNEQEERCRVLEQHQNYLADYVKRRLP